MTRWLRPVLLGVGLSGALVGGGTAAAFADTSHAAPKGAATSYPNQASSGTSTTTPASSSGSSNGSGSSSSSSGHNCPNMGTTPSGTSQGS